MLRASSDNIYVDLPRNREAMLLGHGYSGAYDTVSPRVATYVRSLEAAVGKWSSPWSIPGRFPPTPAMACA